MYEQLVAEDLQRWIMIDEQWKNKDGTIYNQKKHKKRMGWKYGHTT